MWAVQVASCYVPRATCLTQALAAQALLGFGGIPAAVRIGVAKETEDFEAHAWLESGGKILMGGAEAAQRYTRSSCPSTPGSGTSDAWPGQMYSLYGLRVQSAIPLPWPMCGPEWLASRCRACRRLRRENPTSARIRRGKHTKTTDFRSVASSQDDSPTFGAKGTLSSWFLGWQTVRWRKLRDVPDEVLLTYLWIRCCRSVC